MKNLISYEKFTENLIIEGLIKIPKNFYKFLIKEVYIQYLSYLALTHPKEANELAKDYNVEINKNFKPSNEATEIEEIIIDDLPERVKKAWKLQFGHLKFLIDWDLTVWKDRPKVNASYEETNDKGIGGYITLNPRNWIELINSEFDIKNAKEILDKLTISIWHECTHAVQHSSLRWLDPNQIHKSRLIRDNPASDPLSKKREYLSSNVEFDPQIKTKIGIFQKKYKSYNLSQKELSQKISEFVGAVPSSEVDEFFLSLKINDINKWKDAIKKFYLNWNFDITELLK